MFAFSGWIAHMECVVENVQGTSDRGDDRFGVGLREGNEPGCRRTFRLTETKPIMHQRFDGATEWGAQKRRQLARYWRSAISEGKEAMSHGGNDQEAQGSARQNHCALTTVGHLTTRKGSRGTITCGYPSRTLRRVCALLLHA